MKYLLLFFILILFSCSNEPVNMEEVLFERSNQYITKDNFSPYFFFNQKVYNGPAYNRYRSGEKKEQGILKNGYKTGSWTGWNKGGAKRFTGEYKEGKEDGIWIGFHPNGKKKYEGKYANGLQAGQWIYYDSKGKKELEESYNDLGRVIEPK